jgi:uroporphyrinogen-III synthase
MSNSLNGLRILNTRPQNQGMVLSQLIHKAGGIAIACPTLEIKECPNNWIHELPDLNEVDHAIFISANAVEYCFKELDKNKRQWPKHIYVIAIGQGTAKTLQHYQIRVNSIPSVPDSEHVLALLNEHQLQHKKVLLFKGEGGRTVIEEGLRQKQAKLSIFSVYQRIMPSIDYHYINSLWRNDAVDIILLTSEQSIQNLFKLFSREAHPWLQNKPCLVISERLAKAASLVGIKQLRISHPNRIIDTLFDYKDYIHG